MCVCVPLVVTGIHLDCALIFFPLFSRGGARDRASLALTKTLALVCEINPGRRIDVPAGRETCLSQASCPVISLRSFSSVHIGPALSLYTHIYFNPGLRSPGLDNEVGGHCLFLVIWFSFITTTYIFVPSCPLLMSSPSCPFVRTHAHRPCLPRGRRVCETLQVTGIRLNWFLFTGFLILLQRGATS